MTSSSGFAGMQGHAEMAVPGGIWSWNSKKRRKSGGSIHRDDLELLNIRIILSVMQGFAAAAPFRTDTIVRRVSRST